MRTSKKQNPKCTCAAGKITKPKLPAHLRRLKIQPKYVFGYRTSKTVPFLVLQGEWLRNVGFDCEQYVMVSTKFGELLIKTVQE